MSSGNPMESPVPRPHGHSWNLRGQAAEFTDRAAGLGVCWYSCAGSDGRQGESRLRKGSLVRVRQVALTLAVATTLVVTAPACAWALSWSEGGTAGFSGTRTSLQQLTSSGKSRLVLSIEALGSALLDSSAGYHPSSIDPISDGGLLITDANKRAVVMIDSDGKAGWTYSYSDDSTLEEPVYAESTVDGTILIVDRGAHQVIEVDEDKNVLWRYDNLQAPYSAQLTKDGTVLIADASANRVIEVKKDGASGGEIVWQYGVKDKPSSKTGYLRYPTSAQRLDDGHTLITDKKAHRVIEVTKKGKIDWSFGTRDVSGSTTSLLKSPHSATRLSNGDTLIADTNNERVLRVSSAGVESITDTFLEPLTARTTSTGTIVVADSDPGAGDVYAFGYAESGRYDSGSLNLAAPGLKKWVKKISVSASVPDKTKATLQYSFDGGSWKTAKGLSVKWSGNGRKCTYLRVRVKMASTTGAKTPALKTITVSYDLITSGTTSSSSISGGTTGITGITGSTGLLGSTVTSGPATKSGGASTMLPSGTAVELAGANLVRSGYVMDRVSSEMPGADADANKPSLSVDALGVGTAVVLLGTFYVLGLAGPQLSQATWGAYGTLRNMITGRTHG